MEVVVMTGDISHVKLQSNHHHQQTNTQLFTGRMPFLSPIQQCLIKALKGIGNPPQGNLISRATNWEFA